MTKERAVLEYMEKNGSINSVEAFKELGEIRLSAKIFQLRNKGYRIITTKERTENDGQRYVIGCYVLKK